MGPGLDQDRLDQQSGGRFAKFELPLGRNLTVQTGRCVDWENHSLIVDMYS